VFERTDFSSYRLIFANKETLRWTPALQETSVVGDWNKRTDSIGLRSNASLILYVHTYVHTYIHTYTHTYMHECMHACIHTYKHTHTYIYTHTHMHTHIHTCIHTHAHTHTYIHTCMHACIHTYIHTYIFYIVTYVRFPWLNNVSTAVTMDSTTLLHFLSYATILYGLSTIGG
jgi:hypothetical protein